MHDNRALARLSCIFFAILPLIPEILHFVRIHCVTIKQYIEYETVTPE